jgi:hypothetical protein
VFAPTPGRLVPEPEDLIEWMGVEGAFDLDELIRMGSLDARLVATIWYGLARRRSLVVAAGPRLAGKSTTALALLALVPAGTPFLPVGGGFPADLLNSIDAGSAPYLVVNEVSSGIPGRYLWGDDVRSLLLAREGGLPFVGTLHASTPEEVVETFSGPPLMLDPELVAGSLDMVLNLRESHRDGHGARALALVGSVERPGIRELMRWAPEPRRFKHADERETGAALGSFDDSDPDQVIEELSQRTSFLEGLVARRSDASARNTRLRDELRAFNPA